MRETKGKFSQLNLKNIKMLAREDRGPSPEGLFRETPRGVIRRFPYAGIRLHGRRVGENRFDKANGLQGGLPHSRGFKISLKKC